MIPSNPLKSIILLSFVLLSFAACKQNQITEEKKEINVWLKSDPSKLNPLVYPSSVSREVYQYILLSLAEFDPVSLQLRPILIKSIPTPQVIAEGKYKGGLSYRFEILEDATWDDGQPITGNDYLFTMKAIKNPLVQSAAWRPFFEDVKAIHIDKENPKKFEVIYDRAYMLALEALVTANLLPAHIYDAGKAMENISLETLNSENAKTAVEADSAIVKFSQEMNSAKFTREIVVGAGPYKLSQWETDQFVLLEKKANYWGDAHKDNPFLQGYADKLIFKIVKDENAAIGLLKSGGLDFLPNLSSENFKDLQEEEGDLSFFTPQLILYYYLLINNQDPVTGQKSVRQALAHLTDVPQMINNLENGLATRQTGHFHPTKSYYNKNLIPIAFNVEEAEKILVDDGWKDTDGDGIKDKVIDGKRESLEIEFLISKKPLGRKVSLMLQEEGQKIGMKIKLEVQSNPIITERKKNKEYQVNTAALFQDPAPDDPFARWHSDSPGNYMGYSNNELDQLIDQLRREVDPSKRHPLYMRMQEIIYADQPVVFLYSPQSRMVSSNRINASATSKRPGYLANTFTFKK